MLGISMNACAVFLGFGGDSWKEEVLLHDGGKLIVKRSQSYGGRHEIGQPLPIKEHTISFSLPNSNKIITWTSEYGEDTGRTNFNLLALHVLNGVPYVIVEPNLCYSYGKWGRPNPPYVLFKHDGKNWHRLPLSKLPLEFKTINISIVTPWTIRDTQVKFDKGDILFAESIKKSNEESQYPENRAILRELVTTSSFGLTTCPLPSNAAAKIIAPEIDGNLLHYNWWPLAIDWLKNKCPGCDQSAIE